MKQKEKAQSGLEYLMTYGWALVLIAAAIGVLVFIVSSPASDTTFSSSDPTKVLLKAGAVTGSNAEIKLQNITGGKISITGIEEEGYSGCKIDGVLPPIEVAAGGQMALECIAPADRQGTITIQYTDFAGLQRSVTITASGTGGEGEPALVAYYAFNEGSGTTTADSSGNGNTGNLVNDPTWTTTNCLDGTCLSFDGVNDRVNIGSQASLDDLGPVTFSLWIYPKSAGTDEVGLMITKGQASPGNFSFEIDNTGAEDNTFEFNKEYSTTDLKRTANQNQVSYNQWQHIAFTWDGTSNASNTHIYKNGTELPYQNTRNGTGTKNSDAAYDMTIGGRGDGLYHFDGLIDEIKIYDTALNATEIQALYNEYTPP